MSKANAQTKFDQNKYSQAYNKVNYKAINLRINKTTEADVIDRLAQVDSPTAYIRELIRADIARIKAEE